MTTHGGRHGSALADAVAVAEAAGRLPLAVVLLDARGDVVWSNDAVRAVAGGGDAAVDRLLDAVATAAGAAGDQAAVHARLPGSRGLLERELWVAPVRDGYQLVTFHPEIPAAVAREAAGATVEHGRRLEAMLARTRDLVTVLDADGVVIVSNAAAGLLTGLSGGNVNGTDAFALIHPDDRDRAARAFLDVLAAPGPHPLVELRIGFADGTWRDIEATPDNLLDVPGVEGIVVTMHDVTDRKRAEAEAARSQSYLQSLIENLTDVIVVLDADFQVLWSSPALARIIDAPVETNLGQSAFNDMHPDDVEPALRTLTGVAAGELGDQARIDLRLEERPGSGRWRWIEATVVNRLADPHVGGIVCTLRDVSEARLAADELQAAYDRERQAAERLRELDVLKDQFLASVSHEMRTPLAIIIGFADLLGRDDVRPEVQLEALERIRASADDMRAMVEDLLDHSDLEAGRLTVRPRPLPLRRAVEATVGAVGPLLAEHPVAIEIADDVVAVADADGFDRILRNLLANAAKYSDPGRPIVVRATVEGDRVVVEVVDRGVGIPEDQLARVFERLYRAPGAAFVARGTGVGLNTVRRYAELMGGSIEVRSRVGEGSTFTVRLPASLG